MPLAVDQIQTVADFTAASFAASTKTFDIPGYYAYGAGELTVRRTNAQPTHLWRFRTQDRFRADGVIDNTNGGWWEGYSSGGVVTLGGFGAVSDGSTDNYAALLVFNSYAIYLNSLGQRVYLYGTPTHSQKQWNWVATGTTEPGWWLAGITQLTIEGEGTSFQNAASIPYANYNAGCFPSACAPFLTCTAGTVIYNYSGYPINSALTGALSFTLSNVGDASNLHVGDWICLTALAIQMNGWPISTDHFDFVKVVSIVGAVVTIDRPLRYDYLSTYPNWGDNKNPGAASVRVLDAYDFSTAPLTGDWSLPRLTKIPFEVNHIYRNLTMLPLIGQNPAYAYFAVSGDYIEFDNVTLPSYSEQMCSRFVTKNMHCTSFPEPDKLVLNELHVNSVWDQYLTYQSCSIEKVVMINPTISNQGSGLTSNVKEMSITGGNLYNFSNGATYGYVRGVSINGTYINSYGDANPTDSGNNFTVDGVDILFANGVFKVPHSSVNITAINALCGCIPGCQIVLKSKVTFLSYAGDLAVGYVTRQYDDGTHYCVETTLPYSSTSDPACSNWWSGVVVPIRTTDVDFVGCTGSDRVRRSQDANLQGFPQWGYNKFLFYAAPQQSISGIDSGYGKFKRIAISVLGVGATYTGTFRLTIGAFSASAPQTSLGDLGITIDCSLAGRREFYAAGFGTTTGIQGSDAMTLNGSSLSPGYALPSALTQDTATVFYSSDPAGYSANQLPVIELEIENDVGLLRERATSLFSSNNTDKIVKAVGGLP